MEPSEVIAIADGREDFCCWWENTNFLINRRINFICVQYFWKDGRNKLDKQAPFGEIIERHMSLLFRPQPLCFTANMSNQPSAKHISHPTCPCHFLAKGWSNENKCFHCFSSAGRFTHQTKAGYRSVTSLFNVEAHTQVRLAQIL